MSSLGETVLGEYYVLVESNKIKKVTFPCKAAMSEVLAVTNLFFGKFFFSLRTP